MALGTQARTNQEGETMTYTPAATVNSGTVVQVDDLRAGVIVNRLTVDSDGTQVGGAMVEGVFKVRKDSTAFAVGDQVFGILTELALTAPQVAQLPRPLRHHQPGSLSGARLKRTARQLIRVLSH